MYHLGQYFCFISRTKIKTQCLDWNKEFSESNNVKKNRNSIYWLNRICVPKIYFPAIDKNLSIINAADR